MARLYTGNWRFPDRSRCALAQFFRLKQLVVHFHELHFPSNTCSLKDIDTFSQTQSLSLSQELFHSGTLFFSRWTSVSRPRQDVDAVCQSYLSQGERPESFKIVRKGRSDVSVMCSVFMKFTHKEHAEQAEIKLTGVHEPAMRPRQNFLECTARLPPLPLRRPFHRRQAHGLWHHPHARGQLCVRNFRRSRPRCTPTAAAAAAKAGRVG